MSIAMRRGAGALASSLNVTDNFELLEYVGNGSTQDVSAIEFQPGLALIKNFEDNSTDWALFDAARGVGKYLKMDNTAETTDANSLTAFNSNGFSVGTANITNLNTKDFVAFLWRELAGYVDVVTYSGTGSAHTESHNLGVAPSMMWVKALSGTSRDWAVYHKNVSGDPETDYLVLNSTAGVADNVTYWNDTAPTSSVFTVGTNAEVNASGTDYVAILFGEVANRAEYGTYEGQGTSSDVAVNLGYEPQLVMVKNIDNTASWMFFWYSNASSTMLSLSTNTQTNGASAGSLVSFDASGFTLAALENTTTNATGDTYIYSAWR